jgi:hypothetical protein
MLCLLGSCSIAGRTAVLHSCFLTDELQNGSISKGHKQTQLLMGEFFLTEIMKSKESYGLHRIRNEVFGKYCIV